MSVIMHRANTNTSTTVSASCQRNKTSSSPSFLEVIDPVNRTGKITIPMQYIQETRGMNELTRPKDAKDLSLCLLFQKGRCNAGSRCHQIHAEPSFVNKLRTEASNGSACCALHGDFHSASYVNSGLKVEVMSNGSATGRYSLEAFARTATMDGLIAQAQNFNSKVIRVNANKICRLHTQSRCKFGKDCKNVHMCPNAKPLRTEATAAPAPLSGFTCPAETGAFKSAGPLGASSTTRSGNNLNMATRQMKAAPGLDVSRSELSLASSFGGLTASTGGSCPSTPGDLSKSSRSVSVESATPSSSGMSSAMSLSPADSPKEKPLFQNSLFNRCASPAPIAEEKQDTTTTPTTATELVASSSSIATTFASSEDAVFTRASNKTTMAATTPLSVKSLASAMTSQFHDWDLPLRSIASSSCNGPSPLATQGFEQTMDQLAQDLAAMPCSPLAASPSIW